MISTSGLRRFNSHVASNSSTEVTVDSTSRVNANNTSKYQGPAWDNSSEYPNLDSVEFSKDRAKFEAYLNDLRRLSPQLQRAMDSGTIPTAQSRESVIKSAVSSQVARDEAEVLLHNLYTYTQCILSVDGSDEPARKIDGNLRDCDAELEEASNPLSLFLLHTDDDTFAAFIADPQVAASKFKLSHKRLWRDHALSLKEEDLLTAIYNDGPGAWGSLYTTLSAALVCPVSIEGKEQQLGYAEAFAMLASDQPEVRKASYLGIKAGWSNHVETCAASLNSLTGWRLKTYQKRSATKKLHYLDTPLHANCITGATLDTLMATVDQVARPLGQRVIGLQKQLMGLGAMGPWDLYAPCPTARLSTAGSMAAGSMAAGSSTEDGQTDPGRFTFDEAIELIADSCAAIDPEMGDFILLMHRNRWIEGRTGPKRQPGAYCTKFAKSRSPRVYMTFNGSMGEVKTLAHELGHAFHNWVMRDLALPQTNYPMTLAETASIFAETVVGEALLAKATNPLEKLRMLWSSAREVEALLLNVPARFTFERSLFEARRKGLLSVQDLKAQMEAAWRHWYGDTLVEVDEQFWCSKQHFHFDSLSFYNFPYTFGYLFALGVYKKRSELGSGFYQAYVDLLRDTGSMTAEEVARKHLGEDLQTGNFWRASLNRVAESVDQFESLVKEQVDKD